MIEELRKHADPEKAEVLQGFFKTGPGEYGEGDVFIGVKVPDCRKVARRHVNLSYEELEQFLRSEIHEVRLTAALILVEKYKTDGERAVNFYLQNLHGINNWDLVDLTAPKILGDYLLERDKQILYRLAESDNLWKRRVSIVSTLAFVKQGELDSALHISEKLLSDNHDLIHKATGWVLREVGKKDQVLLENFLRKHIRELPRTTLRYAIEKFGESKRQRFLTL